MLHLLTLLALLPLSTPRLDAESPAAATMVWGHSPTVECMWHAEFAKEGLMVDSAGRSFSVGYGQPGANNVPKVAVLQVRDASGALLSQNMYSTTPFSAIYTGVWIPANGNIAFAVGTEFTSPPRVIVSRWLPGPGIPWTNPVNALTVSFTPAQLTLAGTQTYGSRIVRAGNNDLLISGCSEAELFVARLDRATLSLVLPWGIGGAQSVLGPTANACPQHDMPGGFVDFAFYRQSFVEVAGGKVYLGGTLRNLAIAIDNDFTVAAFDFATGALDPQFQVQHSRWLGDDYMKALSATPNGVYAVGTQSPGPGSRMLLIAWNDDGTLRPPFYTQGPVSSSGHDVETVATTSGTSIYVGGKTAAGGATWRYRHAAFYNATMTLPAQWNGAGTGVNPKPYTTGFPSYDSVLDLDLGTGAHVGYVFAAGALQFGAASYGQNLQSITPGGVLSLSANATPTAPGDDRATAVFYHPFSGGNVFTHGTVFDAGSTWLLCIGHWGFRSSRYLP